MEQRYLIDTNVIIDAQVGVLPSKALTLLREIINVNFTISFITYIEVLGYRNIEETTEKLMGLATIIEINKPIMEACIALRKNKKIKLPDALIASTALVNDLIIVSRNTKDFENIPDLTCINPYEL